MDNKEHFRTKLWPHHPEAEELAQNLTDNLILDFNMNLMVYLTQGEMKQCLGIFNKHRENEGQEPLTYEDMKEMYESKENRLKLLKEPGNSIFRDILFLISAFRYELC